MQQRRLFALVSSIVVASAFFFLLLPEGKALAKCEVELARLNQAQANLDAANAAFAKAQQALNAIQQAVANLNAVAKKLGASGQATDQSATFGRPPSNPSFFDNPEYKAAKQAWQNAKAGLANAEGDMDVAGQNRMRAQDEVDAAKKAYDECMSRRRDDEYLKEPEGLKLDQGLDEKLKKLILNDTVGAGETSSDITCRVRKEGNKTFLDASVVTNSPKTQYARWVPQNPSLHLASGAISPAKIVVLYTPVYVKRPVRSSTTSSQAAPLLLGTAMGGLGSRKSSSYDPNDPNCPTTGTAPKQKTSSGFSQAGLGLGLGLLASQPSSNTVQQTVMINEPVGLAVAFDVTGRENELKKALLKTDIVNKDTRQSLPLTMPVHFDWLPATDETPAPGGNTTISKTDSGSR